jgi:NitT/TauT family transport system substrate-binding protein
VRASREGWRAYLDDPRAANAVMARLNTTVDADTFAAVAEAERRFIETDETRRRGLGTMTRDRWETLGRQLVELKFLERAPAVDEYWVAIESVGMGWDEWIAVNACSDRKL